jgi:hypothetical protein
MDTTLGWEQLIDALRNELQEKGGLIGLLNQQSNILYRCDAVENKRLEELICSQLDLVSRSTQGRDEAVRKTVSALHLNDDVQSNEVILGFPDFVHPLLEALFSEIDRLGHRVKERLKLNEGLKKLYLFESLPKVGRLSLQLRASPEQAGTACLQ